MKVIFSRKLWFCLPFWLLLRYVWHLCYCFLVTNSIYLFVRYGPAESLFPWKLFNMAVDVTMHPAAGATLRRLRDHQPHCLTSCIGAAVTSGKDRCRRSGRQKRSRHPSTRYSWHTFRWHLLKWCDWLHFMALKQCLKTPHGRSSEALQAQPDDATWQLIEHSGVTEQDLCQNWLSLHLT